MNLGKPKTKYKIKYEKKIKIKLKPRDVIRKISGKKKITKK